MKNIKFEGVLTDLSELDNTEIADEAQEIIRLCVETEIKIWKNDTGTKKRVYINKKIRKDFSDNEAVYDAIADTIELKYIHNEDREALLNLCRNVVKKFNAVTIKVPAFEEQTV
jgi:hypothetical protein